MKRREIWIPLFCLGLLACGPHLYFSDDEGGPRQGGSAFGHPDELSLPYAQGTKINITVQGADDLASWQVRSDAPAVFSVDRVGLRDRRLVAECTALTEGQTAIRLLDGGGAEQRSAQVRVRAPDRARLFAHGPLRIAGREASSFAATEVKEARILAGGKGAFALAYYRGEERLYGRGVFQSDAPAAVKVEPATTAGFAVNEWIFLSPQAGGPYALRLRHQVGQILDIPVISVPEADLAALSLIEEQGAQTGGKKAGDEIWVLAQARDGASRQVHGVYGGWSLDGVAQVGRDNNVMKTQGDLYRYKYAPDRAPRQLQASTGRLQATLQIRAEGGYVEDTTYLGCSVARRSQREGGLLLLALLALALALVTRRRRRLALLLCLAAPGCAGEEDPPLQIPEGCNPLASEHDCLLPYPSDFFLVDDPALPSGKRVALTEAARPRTRGGAALDFTLTHPVDGFSPNMPILAVFPAPAGVSLEGVVFHTDEPNLSPQAKVLLIDAQEGRLLPVWAELDRNTALAAEQALLIRPFVRLASRRRYVVALHGLRDGAGQPLAAPLGFARVRDGKAATTPALVAQAERYERDVFPLLARLGVPRGDLQLAWDFTTSSEEGDTRDMLDLRADLLTRLLAAPPRVTITKTVENTVAQNENIWLRIEGTIRTPLYLESDQPGAPLHRDQQGRVAYKGEAEVPFTLQVPHKARPQDASFLPARVLQYGHGFFGLREEINYGFMRGYTNEGGYVAAAVDWWGMSEPDLDVVTRAALGAPGTAFDFVDRLHQAMANMIALSYALRGPLVQEPALRRHGKPLYDPGQLYYYGISQGAIFGVTMLALNPVLDRGALSVGGGAYSLMMSRSASYQQLYGLLTGVLPDPLAVQKFTALSQSTWDRVDPMTYAHRLLRQPYPQGPAKRRLLMQIGIGDHSVNNLASHLLARAVGVPLLQPAPRPIWGLEAATAPADEAMLEVDFRLKTLPGVECRLPTEAEKNDVHEGVRRNARIKRQLDAFFRPEGRIEHPCEGPCDPE